MYPKFFSYVNPKTKAPVINAWVTCALMSIPALFFDLEQISKVTSCGNLVTFSFVSACGIALRFRERDTQCKVRSGNEKAIWAFLICAFVFSMSLVKQLSEVLTYSMGALTLVLAVVLCFIKQPNQPRTGHYAMPLVPLLPCVGIMCNFMLACVLDGLTWALWLGFVAIGLVMYFSYSMWNSNLEVTNVTRGQLETSIISGIDRRRSRGDSIGINPGQYIPDEFRDEERKL